MQIYKTKSMHTYLTIQMFSKENAELLGIDNTTVTNPVLPGAEDKKGAPCHNCTERSDAFPCLFIKPAAQIELPDDPDYQAGTDNGDDDLPHKSPGSESDEAESKIADEAADPAQDYISQPAVRRSVLHKPAAQITCQCPECDSEDPLPQHIDHPFMMYK